MDLVLCSVFDAAADAYARPMFVPSRGLAVRSFTDEVNRASPDNIMHQHPEDFSLFCLGTFDDCTGKFVLLPVPELMLRAFNVVKAKE